MEKRLFFRAAMAGLGKYCLGGYGWVYRIMQELFKTKSNGRTARTMASTTCI